MKDIGEGLLLSVRPEFAKILLSGSKTVELRRVRPRVSSGDLVLLYEAAPTMAIRGYLRVRDIEVMSPKRLWGQLGASAHVSSKDYWAYFAGAKRAVAIHVTGPVLFKVPITLPDLRKASAGFRPPRSFRYLSSLPRSILRTLKRYVIR